MPTSTSPSYDTVIIGGACAGLAAATYAARRAMRTLVITKNIGGQIATTPIVENYPGIDQITGPELGMAMYNQAAKWGAEIVYDEVTRIVKNAEQDFSVTANLASYRTRSLILAYGKTPRSLGIPGETTYAGRGVTYCVTCDAPLYRGKTVAVIGGGNSALEGALTLSKIAAKVYLVHRRTEFRGEAVLIEHVTRTSTVEPVLNAVSQEILGDGSRVTGLRVADVVTGATRDISVDGIFVEIGFLVNSSLIKDLVTIDEFNQVVTNSRQETSCPGVFAAGDITDTPYKQAIISSGEGAKAALSAFGYINQGKNVGVDWSGHSASTQSIQDPSIQVTV